MRARMQRTLKKIVGHRCKHPFGRLLHRRLCQTSSGVSFPVQAHCLTHEHVARLSFVWGERDMNIQSHYSSALDEFTGVEHSQNIIVGRVLIDGSAELIISHGTLNCGNMATGV